jgi:hypothetical protein
MKNRVQEGLELLREIRERDSYHVPGHVIGVTRYPEIFEQAAPIFAADLFAIIF